MILLIRLASVHSGVVLAEDGLGGELPTLSTTAVATAVGPEVVVLG